MNESLTGSLLVASSLSVDPVYSRGVCLVVHHDESNVIGVMLNRPMKPSPEALLEMLNQGSSDSGNRLTQDDAMSDDWMDDDDSFEVRSIQAELPHRDSTDSDSTDGDPTDGDPTDIGSPDIASNQGELNQGESFLGMLHFGGPRSGPVVAIHQTSEFAEAETGSGIYVAAQKQHLEELVRDHPAPYRLIVGHLGWEVDELASELEAGIWHIVPATTDAVFSAANDMWPRLVRRATSSSLAQWIGIPDVVDAGELN